MADFDRADADGRTPVHHAATQGRTEELRALIAAGGSVATHDDAQWTPLHSAASAGRAEACELLVDARADPNAKNEACCTPLHYALSKGHGSIATQLLAQGADPTALDKAGSSPLHRGCSAGRLDAVRAACEVLPARVLNLQDRDGNTPLHVAALEAREDVCAVLIDAGADCTIKNGEGRTPLQDCPKDVRERLLARIEANDVSM